MCLVRYVVGRWPLFLCFAFNQCHVTRWLVYTLRPACHVTGRSLIPRPDPVYTIITRDPPLRGLHGICAEKLSTAWALGSSWSVPTQIKWNIHSCGKLSKTTLKRRLYLAPLEGMVVRPCQLYCQISLGPSHLSCLAAHHTSTYLLHIFCRACHILLAIILSVCLYVLAVDFFPSWFFWVRLQCVLNQVGTQ